MIIKPGVNEGINFALDWNSSPARQKRQRRMQSVMTDKMADAPWDLGNRPSDTVADAQIYYQTQGGFTVVRSICSVLHEGLG